MKGENSQENYEIIIMKRYTKLTHRDSRRPASSNLRSSSRVSCASETSRVKSALVRRQFTEAPPSQLTQSFYDIMKREYISPTQITKLKLYTEDKSSEKRTSWQAWIDESPFYSEVNLRQYGILGHKKHSLLNHLDWTLPKNTNTSKMD